MDHWRTSLFAAMLAASGLPLYIHVPRFAGAELGLSLTTVGVVLVAIRFVDFLQDPLLGWMVDRHPAARRGFAAVASVCLAAGFLMLFSTSPPFWPAAWLTLSLVLLFSAYSLATILIYSQSVEIAERSGSTGHLSIASYREAGLIAGVVVASVAPSLLSLVVAEGEVYRSFGYLLAAFTVVAWAMTRGLWTAKRVPVRPLSLGALHEAGASYLLLLGLANALPVALTSTLFLFFVEDRLDLPSYSGLFLILFFASAGAAAPVWSVLARRVGPRQILLPAMVLSIVSFTGAALLPAGAAAGFAVICIASGAALGADMVILPALFAGALSTAKLPAGQAFGIWAFVAKLALALAALTALPFLESWGYVPGAANPPDAVAALNFTYAILPCLLKLVVVAMVFRLPRKALQP